MLTGSRLGPYEVLATLGEGGMGAVYRARDTKLNRDVALKVLLPEVAGDPERLARFRREAQVLASLNHPHIGAIYGLEESAPSADSGSAATIALVMELVEGLTLQEVIEQASGSGLQASGRVGSGPQRDGGTGQTPTAQGPQSGRRGVPIDEALAIARQIAEALEAAHEQGIIHRDLKPANIKVRADGTVKVLDFGLAKAIEQAPGSGLRAPGSASISPTLTSPALMTGAGIILGTAAYMAPEQARGRVVDKRADIWAFGVVLYEMVTGERLFHGEDVTDTLASVVRDQPDLTKAPPGVRRLLHRCLEKDPKKRLRDLGDVWDLLETSSAAHATGPATTAPERGSRQWAWAATALAATALAITASVTAYRATRPVERPLIRVNDQLEPGISVAGGVGSAVAIAPDGSRLAFVTIDAAAVTHLSVRKLDEARSTVLAGTNDAEAPFFSPDGRWIGFYTARTLRKISVDGGAAITICEMPTGVRGGSFWADDGTIFTAGLSTPVLRVPAAGGTPTPVTQLEARAGALEPSHRAAQLLPGGDALLFEASPDRQMWEDANIEVQSLRTGDRKTLVHAGYYGRYVPGRDPSHGYVIYVHGDTLFAAPMDAARLELTGPAMPILQNDVARRNANGIAHLAVSPSGTLVYVSGAQSVDSMFWMDADGRVEGLPASPGPIYYYQARISPDGTRVAVHTDPTSARLSVLELTTSRLTTVVTNASQGPVVWSRDGEHVAVQLRQDATRSAGIYWTRADASIEPVLLVPGSALQPGSFSHDGRRLLYASAEGLWSTVLDLSNADHPTAQEPESFLPAKVRVERPVFSPDGRWVAYTSAESTPQGDVFVRPFPAPGGRWQISTGGGSEPQWSPNGRELLYVQGRTLMAVPYSAKGDTFVAGQPHPWSASPLRPTPAGRPGFDIAPNGLRVLTTMPATTAKDDQPSGLTFLFNFADELRRRVPAQ